MTEEGEANRKNPLTLILPENPAIFMKVPSWALEDTFVSR